MAKVNPIELQNHLKGVDYPAHKENLIAQAEKLGADDTIRSVLSQIPDRDYETPAAVNKAIGELELCQVNWLLGSFHSRVRQPTYILSAV